MKSFYDVWKHKEIYEDLVKAYHGVKLESDFCTQCKNVCCLNSPCNYYPEDFASLSPNKLYEVLQQGNISVKAFFDLNEFLQLEPVLYLRARGKDRGVIDLISPDTACSMYTEKGCTYSFDERPTGGTLLIPKRPRRACEYPAIESAIFIRSWRDHQIPLQKVVKKFTNLTVSEEILREIKEMLIAFKKMDRYGTIEQEMIANISMLSQMYLPLKEAVERNELSLELLKK